MTRMYIDDERVAPPGFDVVARSSQEAIDYMRANGIPSFISFDHDLGGNDIAMKVVRWMIDYVLDGGDIPSDFEFEVHSANPVGAENIRRTLSRFLRHLRGAA